jgi:hypothetical protein
MGIMGFLRFFDRKSRVFSMESGVYMGKRGFLMGKMGFLRDFGRKSGVFDRKYGVFEIF